MSDPENREHPTPEEPEVTESAVDGNGGNEPVVDAEVADTAADAAAAADTAEQAPEESLSLIHI